MNLFCADEGVPLVRAQSDPVILDDPRVVKRLLDIENQYLITENYFTSVQDEITPTMRKICLSWLMEVADNEKCEDAVFPLAANLMDRFLSKQKTPKTKLQLVASVSLMIASKIRQSRVLGSSLLSAYTDRAFSSIEIVMWEMDVLAALEWNLSSVIPHDYLDTMIFRLPDFQRVQQLVQKHAKTFQQLTVLEFEFAAWPASLLAMATIGAAVRGLPNIETVWPPVTNLHQLFFEMTYIEMDTIINCIEYMETFVNKCINRVQRIQEQTVAEMVHKTDGHPPPDDNPDSPTDIKDVRF